MIYKLRDDVILEKVSGIYLLISLRSAWGETPFAIQISPSSAYIWQCIKNEMDEEEIIKGLMELKEYPQKKAEKVLQKFIQSALEKNYFLVEKL